MKGSVPIMSYLAVFLSGILSALPFLSEYLAFLPYFSLIPLFCFSGRVKSSYRHGLAFSAGYYGVIYTWFLWLYPLDFLGFSKIAGLFTVIFCWLGLSLLQGLGTAFVPVFYKRLISEKRPWADPLIAASVWCIMEWAQNLFWFGVPWARLALTQYKLLPMIQSASLFGSLFVSFLIVLVNGLLLMAIKSRKKDKRLHVSAYIALGLVLANFTFGEVKLALSSEDDEGILCAAIQGNIASGDKWADDSLQNSLRIYKEITLQAVEKSGAQLVVWPESVIPVSLNYYPNTRAEISAIAKQTGAYIAVGSFYGEEDEDGEELTYNAIYLFEPDGKVNERVYKKRHLVPFGEYIPMPQVINTVLPFLSELNMFKSQLTAGEGSEVFNTEMGSFGSLICFDSIYESLAADTVRDGAQILFISTNDSWYLDSPAVYQHNAHAVLRAVENGRCVIRAANTGISSLISANGKIKNSLEPLVGGYVAGSVELRESRTLYSYVGNIIVWLSFALCTSAAGIKIYEGIKKKRKMPE